MATVIKNADNTLTVTLILLEQKVLLRWAAEKSITPAKQFEDVVNGFFANKINDYRGLDGPAMRDKYDAVTPTKQAQIDTLLG